MNIVLKPKKILKINFLFFMILLILNMLVIITLDISSTFYKVLSFRVEGNIPTLYSVLNLFLASLLIFIISKIRKKNKKSFISWQILSFIFLFLSIDEAVKIHERSIDIIRQYLGVGGVFYYAWIIPYSIFVLLFIICYFKFWISLPNKIQKLFLLSGILYIGGAVGIEMIGGVIAESSGTENIFYELITTVEESLEMLGIIIFNFSLLSYFTDFLKEELHIKITNLE